MHPARHGALFEHPAPYRAYYSEEDALVYRDIELTKEQEGRTLKHTGRPTPSRSTSVPSLRDSLAEMEEEDLEAIPISRPRNPTTYEEALESLGSTPTEADLGPHSPTSCSSSLVLYGVGEDSSTEEDHEDQIKGAEAMDTDGQITDEPKEGMGIRTAPFSYQLTSPRYIHDGDEEYAGKDSSSNEDVEDPFWALGNGPTTRTLDDIKTAFCSIKKAASEAKSIAASSGDESVPDLIGLDEEASVPPSLPPKRPPTQLPLGWTKRPQPQPRGLCYPLVHNPKAGQ